MENRIPNKYFITSGNGESEYEIHAGSYHMALYAAGIHNYNIITYSSVMPSTAIEIQQSTVFIPFGSELFTIMSCVHGNKGEHLSCALAFGKLYDYNKLIGYIVCEVKNNIADIDIINSAKTAILDLKSKTYSTYDLRDIKYIKNQLTPKLKYGTSLIAICFYDFI